MRMNEQLTQHAQSSVSTTTFLGLNKGIFTSDGEMNDMENLTSDYAPNLAPCHPRVDTNILYTGTYHGSITKANDLYSAVGTQLLKNGTAIDGLTLTNTNKQMVSMGAVILIWPDKVYYNTTTGEYGAMGKSWKTHTETATGGTVNAQYSYKEGSVSRSVSQIQLTGTATSGSTFDYSVTVVFAAAKTTDKSYTRKSKKKLTLTDEAGHSVDMGTQEIQIKTSTTGLKTKTVTYTVTGSAVNVCTGSKVILTVTTIDGSGIYCYSQKNSTLYLNATAHVADISSDAGTARTITGNTVTMFPSDMQGNSIVSDITVSATQPSTTTAVKYWFCTVNNAMYVYDTAQKAWTLVEHSYIAISSGDPINAFDVDDAIWIEAADGEWKYSSTPGDYTKEIVDGLHRSTAPVVAVQDNLLVVEGLITESVTVTNFTAEVRIPDFDYVCESNNRIWGCMYGASTMTDEAVNQIMACRNGDYHNWEAYLGVSTDSYAVSMGSDGAFTGAISYNGTPCFFREGVLHRIYGEIPSNYSTNTINCRGVDAGDSKSLQQADSYLIYKTIGDVLIWNGNMSFNSIGKKLGYTVLAQDTKASCVLGMKYYLLLTDGLYVYDIERGMWHRESNTNIVDVIATDERVYLMENTTNGVRVKKMSTEADNATGTVEWSATFGAEGYDSKTHKYLSRYDLRMYLPVGSMCMVELQYDHDGRWCRVGTLKGRTIQTFMLPVMPRRCDHCQLRLSGKGKMKLLSVARILEQGSDN